MNMLEEKKETALVVLRPEESRRLIGRGVAALPQVQSRLKIGRMVIVGGSTTRHVVDQLLGKDPGLATFAVGWIRDGQLGESPEDGQGPFLIEDGQVSRGWPAPLLERYTGGDIYIKGANAIDPSGNAAILMGSPTGGTIGVALPLLQARGCELIIPVSLQKLIPSVPKAAPLLGQGKVKRVMGGAVGYMPIMAGTATVMTEVEALSQLFDVTATPVAAGGLDDCAGCVVLHLAGIPEMVEGAWNLLESIRHEG